MRISHKKREHIGNAKTKKNMSAISFFNNKQREKV